MKDVSVRKMKPFLFWIAASGITLCYSVCGAQEINKDETVAKSVEKSERECRTSRSKGSKIRRSICLTKEEWVTVDAREQEMQTKIDRDKDTFFRKSIQQGSLNNSDPLDSPGGPAP